MMPNKKGAARRLRLNFTYILSMARCAGKMGHGFGLYFPIGMKWVAEIGRRRGLDKVCADFGGHSSRHPGPPPKRSLDGPLCHSACSSCQEGCRLTIFWPRALY